MNLTILPDSRLSPGDAKALEKLWHLLVSDPEYFIAPCTKKAELADVYCIDLPLMLDEGLPAFAQTIGEKRLQALLRYCGYGVKFARPLSDKIRDNDLACLRTIENAQHYLHGFKRLLSMYASHLSDAPESFDTITKAKYVRSFILFFAANEFFPEELVPMNDALSINHLICDEISGKNVGPEEMFLAYKFFNRPTTIRFSGIELELSFLGSKLKKKVLELSELNTTIPTSQNGSTYKFRDYRSIKCEIHKSQCYAPIPSFYVKEEFLPLGFPRLFTILLALLYHPFSDFEKKSRTVKTFENNVLVRKNVDFYEFSDESCGTLPLADENEIARYLDMFKYLADQNLKLSGPAYNIETGEKIPEHLFEWQTYHALALFALQRKYIGPHMSIPDSLSRIDTLAEFYAYDDEAATQKVRVAVATYWYSDKTEDAANFLAEAIGIDAKFEEERFGIKQKKAPEQVLLTFAETNGIQIENMDVTQKMIHEFWIPNYSDEIENFDETGNEKAFKKAIGYDKDFANAYFNLSDIDIEKVQEKLIDLKRRRVSAKEMKANALLINLYCYLIEENIPCGPKNRIPERVKALKPSILKELLSA